MGPLCPAGARFTTGQIVSTPGALRAMNEAGVQSEELLLRHLTGDWCDLDEEDKNLNEKALEHGDRILSGYDLPGGPRVWIITEADRSATTFLLREEY